MTPLRWTTKSTRTLAGRLGRLAFACSYVVVNSLLKAMGYSLPGTAKTLEGTSHPDWDAQFRYLAGLVTAFQAAGDPVIRVDNKKKRSGHQEEGSAGGAAGHRRVPDRHLPELRVRRDGCRAARSVVARLSWWLLSGGLAAAVIAKLGSAVLLYPLGGMARLAEVTRPNEPERPVR